jgi:hypothetical protein
MFCIGRVNEYFSIFISSLLFKDTVTFDTSLFRRPEKNMYYLNKVILN